MTPSAFGAQKALFLCSVAHTDVQPCFRFFESEAPGPVLRWPDSEHFAREMSTPFRLVLLTRGIFFKGLLKFFPESQSGSCVFSTLQACLEALGMTARLPVPYLLI